MVRQINSSARAEHNVEDRTNEQKKCKSHYSVLLTIKSPDDSNCCIRQRSANFYQAYDG